MLPLKLGVRKVKTFTVYGVNIPDEEYCTVKQYIQHIQCWLDMENGDVISTLTPHIIIVTYLYDDCTEPDSHQVVSIHDMNANQVTVLKDFLEKC